MDAIIDGSRIGPIDFAPVDTYTEILQNVRTILATVKFSVPLDRDFGIDASIVDMPMPVAKAKLASEIVTALKRYEPRVSVTNISWSGTDDGILKPKVQVRINDAS